jgi:hypothetical protein
MVRCSFSVSVLLFCSACRPVLIVRSRSRGQDEPGHDNAVGWALGAITGSLAFIECCCQRSRTSLRFLFVTTADAPQQDR